MSIIESLKKLVDPSAAREQAAELERLREQPTRDDAGSPPTFECRVCGRLGPEPRYCPECLAETMRPSAKTAPSRVPPSPSPSLSPEPSPVPIPIDGTLDLHTVHPAEVRDILPEYLDACAARGISDVRIVHGRGTGALRRTVESLLARSPLVAEFRTADESAGGWGATLVRLRASK